MEVHSLRWISEYYHGHRYYLLFNRRLQKRVDVDKAGMKRLLLTADVDAVEWQLLGTFE